MLSIILDFRIFFRIFLTSFSIHTDTPPRIATTATYRRYISVWPPVDTPAAAAISNHACSCRLQAILTWTFVKLEQNRVHRTVAGIISKFQLCSTIYLHLVYVLAEWDNTSVNWWAPSDCTTKGTKKWIKTCNWTFTSAGDIYEVIESLSILFFCFN